MYRVTIEIHATPSKYWARMRFTDRYGKVHKNDIEQSRDSTTNSNALQAAIASLRILQRPCLLDIHTDNEYIANSIVNGWANTWKQNGWKNAKGSAIKHKEQWQELMSLLANHSCRFSVDR